MQKLQLTWRAFCHAQFYILLVAYIYLGVTPTPEQSIPLFFNDKLMHFFGYFIAAFSITAAFPRQHYHRLAGALILFSIAIEIAQHFNPPRTFSLADIIANSLGVYAGSLCVRALIKHCPWIQIFISGDWIKQPIAPHQ